MMILVRGSTRSFRNRPKVCMSTNRKCSTISRHCHLATHFKLRHDVAFFGINTRLCRQKIKNCPNIAFGSVDNCFKRRIYLASTTWLSALTTIIITMTMMFSYTSKNLCNKLGIFKNISSNCQHKIFILHILWMSLFGCPSILRGKKIVSESIYARISTSIKHIYTK